MNDFIYDDDDDEDVIEQFRRVHVVSQVIEKGKKAQIQPDLITLRLPFSIRCWTCQWNKIIPSGTRWVDVEKTPIGILGDKPVSRLRKQHDCGQWIELEGIEHPFKTSYNVLAGGIVIYGLEEGNSALDFKGTSLLSPQKQHTWPDTEPFGAPISNWQYHNVENQAAAESLGQEAYIDSQTAESLKFNEHTNIHRSKPRKLKSQGRQDHMKTQDDFTRKDTVHNASSKRTGLKEIGGAIEHLTKQDNELSANSLPRQNVELSGNRLSRPQSGGTFSIPHPIESLPQSKLGGNAESIVTPSYVDLSELERYDAKRAPNAPLQGYHQDIKPEDILVNYNQKSDETLKFSLKTFQDGFSEEREQEQPGISLKQRIYNEEQKLPTSTQSGLEQKGYQEDNLGHTRQHRSSPQEEDDLDGVGLSVQTAKDIAEVIYNIGWKGKDSETKVASATTNQSNIREPRAKPAAQNATAGQTPQQRQQLPTMEFFFADQLHSTIFKTGQK